MQKRENKLNSIIYSSRPAKGTTLQSADDRGWKSYKKQDLGEGVVVVVVVVVVVIVVVVVVVD